MFTTRSVRLKELLVQKLTGRVWKFGSFPDKIRVKSSETSSICARRGANLATHRVTTRFIDSGLVGWPYGEVSQGEKMLYSGTDPESYITEYTLVYSDEAEPLSSRAAGESVNCGALTGGS